MLMMDCGSTIFIFLAFIQATLGQTVTVNGPSAVEQGSNTPYTCELVGGTVPPVYTWTDISVSPSVNIFIAGRPAYLPEETKYVNFDVSESGGASTMTITNTQIEDEGQYRCSEGQLQSGVKELKVEVQGTPSFTVVSDVQNGIDVYIATCRSTGGRPEETLTLMLGDEPVQCDSYRENPLQADEGLYSKEIICTLPATMENYDQTLRCVISGHNVSALNGEVTEDLDMHSAPNDDIVMVKFESRDPKLRVTCDIKSTNQPTPAIRNYYIYVNDTLKHTSTTGVNSVNLTESEYDLSTEFECVAGNYLGNTTSGKTKYDPSRTTESPPTTAPNTSEPVVVVPTGTGDTETGLEPAAIAGIAVGAIIFIAIIIVLIVIFVVKPDCIGGSGSPNTTTTHKHSTSAVGSSNGNEKEKIRPEAAPRGHSSIKHTTDNPQQAEYAMVDRKPGGRGDSTDARGNGAGQNEQPGMHYADLDLTSSAGHSDRVVPKNEDGVVVYSSILV